MGRFAIDADNLHEEVDSYQEAWTRALALHAEGYKSVNVLDNAAKPKPAIVVEKKGAKKK